MDGRDAGMMGRDGADAGAGVGDRVRWARAIGVGAVLLAAYLANGRCIGAGDTEPAKFLPVAILRGDGPVLDRFEGVFRAKNHNGDLPYFLVEARGHIVSRYPLGPALLALPFDWPQVVALDWLRPSWEREAPDAWITLIAKNTHALIGALTGVALFATLCRLGLSRVATATTLVAGLGSGLWSVASQAPWQHGPAALALTLAVGLLSGGGVSRTRLVLAGLAAASLAAFRPIDAVLSFAIFLWVVGNHRRQIVPFSIFPVLVAGGLIAYNVWCFGDLRGGYGGMQGKDGSTFAECWDTGLVEGTLGTLFSPARGLLIYTPWIALAVLTLPAVAGRIRGHSFVAWMLGALVPYGLLLAKYRWWNAGWSYGPRYWTDVLPLFAIVLGFGLDWARERSRALVGGYAMAAVAAVAIHAVGAFYFPSSWNAWPDDSNEHRERLWSWRDSEITRCLAEGPHPAGFRPWSPGAVKSAAGFPRPHGYREARAAARAARR